MTEYTEEEIKKIKEEINTCLKIVDLLEDTISDNKRLKILFQAMRINLMKILSEL